MTQRRRSFKSAGPPHVRNGTLVRINPMRAIAQPTRRERDIFRKSRSRTT